MSIILYWSANAFARAKVILHGIDQISNNFFYGLDKSIVPLPNSLKMHRANLDYNTTFFVLENTVSFTSRHSNYIKQFCAIDHIVVCNQSSRH